MLKPGGKFFSVSYSNERAINYDVSGVGLEEVAWRSGWGICEAVPIDNTLGHRTRT